MGCGGAGSAAAWQLAGRGRQVTAIDRFEPGHRRGSSHGTERIVRAAYADPLYVELAVASVALWRQIEREVRVDLLHVTGGIDYGFPEELEQIAANCRAAGVRVDLLDRDEAIRRFPGFTFDGPVLHQPGTATVHAERAVAAMQRGAVGSGAAISFGEQVVAVERDGDRAVVRTDRRILHADTCVVTTGAWASSTLAGLVDLPPITVTQEQTAYFRSRISDWPTFIERAQPSRYGMRTPDGLVKVGEHATGPVVDPDRRSFALDPQTWERLLEWVRTRLPGVDPHPVGEATCLYATTPTEDFVLDRIGPFVVAVGLAGHGFKFLPELGRRVADLVDGSPADDNPFALRSRAARAGASGHK